MSKKKFKRPQKYVKPKDPTFKEWWAMQSEKKQKNLKIAAIAVVALIVLSVVFYYGIYDDGSLKIKNNAAVGKEDNWLIAELDGGKNSDYYHLANVNLPEGYAVSETSASGTVLGATQPIDNDFTFNPVDETLPVDNLYVRGVSKDAVEMVESVHVTFSGISAETGKITEIKTMDTVHGKAYYFLYDYSYENPDEGNKVEYSQSLVCYVPALRKNACVLVAVNNYPETAEGYAEEAVLLEAVNSAIAAIELVEK